jgi:hypothetical protein
MKSILFGTSFLFIGITFGQGLKLDTKAYQSAEQFEPTEEQGFAQSVLPSKISYRIYTPMVDNQGENLTCVGWAVSYAQLSTQQNLQMGITDDIQKLFRAMDPYFVYSLIKGYNNKWCQEGSSIEDALEVLKAYGTKPYFSDPWLKCNSTITQFAENQASYYTISGWKAVPNEGLVKNVKTALNNKLIVSVGVELTESFENGTAVSFGMWAPKYGETLIGGHAMCVVGYDDNKYGGSFEVMNSWGDKYGDNGFVWIKYADFAKLVSEAYVIYTNGFKTGSCSYGDCANSYSRYKFNTGEIFEGIIKNNYPDVFGSYIYPNGNFYIGGFLKGRKHGQGVYFDMKKGAYYSAVFNNDVWVRGELKQGYVTEESDKKLSEILTMLQDINPGKVIQEDSPEFEKFIESLEVPEIPMITINEDK